MHNLSFEKVKHFLENNSLEFHPSQEKISYPIITRIHRRLSEGHSFNNIKVANSVINDGHHRFISLCLLNKEIKWDPAAENLTKGETKEWRNVILDRDDYDNETERRKFVKQFDTKLKMSNL